MLPTQEEEYGAIKDAYDLMLKTNAAAIAGHRERERERKDAEERKDQAQKREVEVLASKVILLSSKVHLLEEQKRDLQDLVQAQELEIEKEQALNREQRRALGEEGKAHQDMLSEWHIKQERVAAQRRQEGIDRVGQ